ncbi:PAS domain-containing protein [Celeribacter neptunius]|uniref:PAS domain-containing protein n=1 Tax=Celeribacter neptunius TaxID=588602 RepID=A0A1I3L0D7_9RHOB|nr:PAS domain-containing protein [Celeribacter neptunius]SFI78140.1 PAS domain-containing protein [Celeribacter neptunius]
MKIEYVSGSNVVSLMPRRNEMHFPALKTVEAYWDGLRNGRPVPARAEIDPRGMQSALEFAFILERIAPGVARFRLAGMHLTDLMGMEVRGMPLTAMFVPESRAKISEALEAVFETPQITVVTLKAERGIGRGAMDAQLLLCPLKSDLGDVNRILGCLQSKGEIGRQPRRFEVVDVASRPLLSDNPTDQTFDTTAKGTPIPAGFAEAKRAFDETRKAGAGDEASAERPAPRQDPMAAARRSKPVLRLVKTDS